MLRTFSPMGLSLNVSDLEAFFDELNWVMTHRAFSGRWRAGCPVCRVLLVLYMLLTGHRLRLYPC